MLRAAIVGLTAGALVAGGCHRTFRMDAGALAAAIVERDTTARLLAPRTGGGAASGPGGGAAAAAPAGDGGGIAVRSGGGEAVEVPPHAKLRLETGEGPWVIEPRALHVDGGDFVAGDRRVPRASVRGAAWRRPSHAGTLAGVGAVLAVVFGLTAVIVYIEEH